MTWIQDRTIFRTIDEIIRLPCLLVCLLTLAACTTLPDDFGRGDIATIVGNHGVTLDSPEAAKLPSLDNDSLTVTQAVRYAMLNNPDIKAIYAELGFTAADLYDAGRIRNPVLSAALLSSDASGAGDQLSLGIVATIADIVTLSARQRLANAEYAAVRQVVAFAVLDLAAATQTAYFEYVGARQTSLLRLQTQKAASLSLALSEQFYLAGNIAPKAIALERAAAAQANLVALQAELARVEARTELATLLGIPPSASWDVPGTLPLPAQQPEPLETLMTLALQTRLDLTASKIRADYLADQLKVANWNRWLSDLALGYERERETSGEILKGPTLEWEIPLFTFRRSDLLRAEAELLAQIAQLETMTLGIEHEVQLAYTRVQNAQDRINIYQNKLVPALVDATKRAQREQNFMLIGVFELIETKQQEYDAYEGYIEAVRDYWLARTALSRAVGRQLPINFAEADAHLRIESVITPQSEQSVHEQHQTDTPTTPHHRHH